MGDAAGTIVVEVKFGKEKLEFSSAPGEEETADVAWLMGELEERTGVIRANQKLISKGERRVSKQPNTYKNLPGGHPVWLGI